MKVSVNGSTIEILEGDITLLDRDAIVNAANEHLILGGGVAGAIARRGGPSIQEECNRIGGSYVGGAAITTGGTLKARHVIHAVGPRMGEGDEDEKLRNATLNSLKLAAQHGLRSVAFPAVSTGIFGYPLERCAEIMLRETIGLLERDTRLSLVTFCLYGPQAETVFKETLARLTETH